MKKREKLRTIILFLLFVGVLSVSLWRISYVLREKHGTSVQDNFMQLKRDSVDVVFIGTSHQFCSINPDLLYEEYGIDNFMLATSAQTIPMSYYAVMEAIEYQHPKAIVLEALYCSNDFQTVSPEMSHTFFDGMPLCEAKKMAIEDLIEEEEQIYYYLNLGFYHSRWKELSKDDFQSNLTSPRGGFYSDEVMSVDPIPLVSKEEKEAMPEEMQKYLDKIVQLCEENHVELILYVAPFNALHHDEGSRLDLCRRQRIFNWLEDYAKDKDLRYYNLFHEMEAINLDEDKDFMDTQHFNCYGQEKLTRYMAEKGYFDISEEYR